MQSTSECSAYYNLSFCGGIVVTFENKEPLAAKSKFIDRVRQKSIMQVRKTVVTTITKQRVSTNIHHWAEQH